MDSLTIIEHSGQRALTTTQIADAFRTDVERVQVNFNRNKDRFVSGKHYFLLEGEELREFKTAYQIDNQLKHVRSLYLWTEQGAWLIAKTINTNEAWDAFRKLIDDYYNIKAQKIGPLTKEQALATVLRTTADLVEGHQEIRQIVAEQEQEIQEVRTMVIEQITLNYGEQRRVQKAVAARVYGIADDPSERQEFFRQLYREIKDRWAVGSYKDVRRNELASVLKYIDAWCPRLVVV